MKIYWKRVAFCVILFYFIYTAVFSKPTRLALDVYPPIQMVGKETFERVRVIVDPVKENYGVDLIWESDGTFDASWINLYGDSGPRTTTRYIRVRHPGEYVFTAVLRPSNIRVTQIVQLQ